MCSIVGWTGNVPSDWKKFIVRNGSERGRDGYGFWVDGKALRGFYIDENIDEIIKGENVVGNFRATPTTESESRVELLQPYDGIVHNGCIANDNEFGDFPIDSMALPIIFARRGFDNILDNLYKIKGSYALAYFEEDGLILACNYKPIYFSKLSEGFIFASTPSALPSFSIPVPPYSALLIKDDKLHGLEIPRMQSNKVVISASGGLDSTTVAYMLKEQGYDVTLIHFKYGCKAEKKESDRIFRIADDGGFDLKFIDMPDVMSGSITKGDYHKNGIEGTEYAIDWVSARNLLMLAILTAYAETNKYGYIAFGGNLEESNAYPDNEQEFGRKFNDILPYATQNGIKIQLLQPLSTYMKHEIVKIGNELKVPFNLTWSCYGDGDEHCGTCGPCFMRQKAFERNSLNDPVFL